MDEIIRPRKETEHPVCRRSVEVWGDVARILPLPLEKRLAISKVNYLLQEIKIQGGKPSRIDDHFFVEND